MTAGEWIGVAIGFAVPLSMIALGFVLARIMPVEGERDGR